MVGADFPEARLFYPPAEVGAHQPVLLRAINGELLATDIGEAILAGALQDEVCCLLELRRCRYAMKRRQVSEVFVGNSSVRLVPQHRPLTSSEKWLLGKNLKRREAQCGDKGDANQAEGVHKLRRIAFRSQTLLRQQPGGPVFIAAEQSVPKTTDFTSDNP